ncbi:MAG TPA: ThuA domain-containing protein [Prosthecobacter sp.]
MKQFVLSLLSFALVSTSLRAADHVVYEPAGEAKGKHVVLLSGDEEYRSEEAMPMLGKVLSQRHGFKCTVLFSLGADGTIDPTAGGSLSHPEALDSADAIVMLLRFRHWDEATSKKFEAAVNRGVPIIGLRTSTHAFNGYPKGSRFESWNFGNKGGWGRKFLGETWVSHWGKHKVEATKGVVEAANASHPILRGVGEIFGNSDVYEAAPPEDAVILVRGQILQGMTADTPPASYSKKTSGGKVEQDVNKPMMPVAWTRTVKNDSGTENKVFCSTMGAATDLAHEGTRRMVVNSVFWGLGLEVPEKADVTTVGEYNPTMYGFKGFKTGLKPDDFLLAK